jgi:uncharacterized protein YndB with AHSA1/START domain
VRTCAIEKKPFAAVEAWLSAQRAFWEGRAPTGSSGLTPPPGRRKNQNDPIFKSRRESSRRPVGHLERLNGPRELEQWWVPAPAKCKVLDMDLRPGGSFVTRISENGGDFMPHLNACFLAIDDLERIDSHMLWSVYGDPPNNRMDGELSACRRNEPVGGNRGKTSPDPEPVFLGSGFKTHARSATVCEFYPGGLQSASERSDRGTVGRQGTRSNFEALDGW